MTDTAVVALCLLVAIVTAGLALALATSALARTARLERSIRFAARRNQARQKADEHRIPTNGARR